MVFTIGKLCRFGVSGMPLIDFSWKCGECGMTSRKEPHRSLPEHMYDAHGMVWSYEQKQYVSAFAGKEVSRAHTAPGLQHLELAADAARREREEIKAELIRMRFYAMRRGLAIGECVAWCKIKERFGIGIRDADDEQWLKGYESRQEIKP